MSKQVTSLVLTLVFLLQGCTNITNTPKVSQSEEIRESLFKYLLGKSNTKNKLFKLKVYYFLGVEGKDPSKRLIKKIKKIKKNVYPSSQSIAEKNNVFISENIKLSGISRHKTLGGIGVSYGVGEIKWVSKNKVMVSWSSYLSSLNASYNIATLELINKKWVVTSSLQKAVAKLKPNKAFKTRTYLSWASCFEVFSFV